MNGFDNLFAMEIDPNGSLQEMIENCKFRILRIGAPKLKDIADQSGGMGSMMQDLAFAIPGVDEAMGFAEIMKCVMNHPTVYYSGKAVANNADTSSLWSSQ